jgi:dihydroorotase
MESALPRCKNTRFGEARLQGRVLRTIVAGRTVFEYAGR